MNPSKILLVDDHPLLRSGIIHLFERDPEFEVCGEAGDRAEMIRELERFTPDAVILDISMGAGKESGLDLIPDIHARAGRVPILVMSMLDEEIYGERARLAGASGFLSKQKPVRQVLVAIRALLEGKTYFLGEVAEHEEPSQMRQRIHQQELHGLSALSPREFEVFRLLGEGLPPRVIAEQLHLSVRTVEVHRTNIRAKLEIGSAAELVRYAVQWRRSER